MDRQNGTPLLAEEVGTKDFLVRGASNGLRVIPEQ